jgi:hypothetical protein
VSIHNSFPFQRNVGKARAISFTAKKRFANETRNPPEIHAKLASSNFRQLHLEKFILLSFGLTATFAADVLNSVKIFLPRSAGACPDVALAKTDLRPQVRAPSRCKTMAARRRPDPQAGRLRYYEEDKLLSSVPTNSSPSELFSRWENPHSRSDR